MSDRILMRRICISCPPRSGLGDDYMIYEGYI